MFLANATEYKSIEEALQAPDKDKVYKLNLSSKALTKLPAEVFQFRNLQALACSSNQLTSLPAEIGKLANLTELYCYKNQLTSLPAEIGKLANLSILDCSSNQFAGVMDYIKKPISELELLARVKSAVELSQAKRKAEELLLKIFPKEVVEELKETDDATPRHFKSTSILFADVNGFSTTARRLKDEPEKLVAKLDECFEALDDIAVKYDIERIKTIGDCYMAVAGIPTETKSHAVDIVLAGLGMQAYMEERRQNMPEGEDVWRVRLGIHTGDLVAGIIGKVKFAYDVWGDSVNLASLMESTGEVGKVHITETTYDLVKDFFLCEKKAELVYAKNIGDVQTYFVLRLKPEYSADEAGFMPNTHFEEVKKQKFSA